MRDTIEQLLKEGMTVRQVMAKLGLPESERWQVESVLEDPSSWMDEYEYRALVLIGER